MKVISKNIENSNSDYILKENQRDNIEWEFFFEI